MRLKVLQLLWIAGFLIANVARAQGNIDFVEKLTHRLDELSELQPKENLFIQTSKGMYETEEDLWFKVYVLNSKSFHPSTLSKTLYVQLTNFQTSEVVWQEKYEIEEGFVNGHIFLPSSLAESTYVLSAYSKHSIYPLPTELNAVRMVKIVHKIEQPISPSEFVKDSTIDFRTFPEGGHLVEGIPNNLGFKAVNSKGRATNVAGTLFEDGRALLNFNSVHDGMGKFSFSPIEGRNYHIELATPGKKKIYQLPEIKKKGLVLQLVKKGKAYLLFDILKPKGSKEEMIYFTLQIRGVLYSAASGRLKSRMRVKVPLHDLPQGIAEVTVYDNNLLAQCERLVYVHPDKNLMINTSILEHYSNREKVKLKIKVTDAQNKPVVAHLGMSIYDKWYQNKDDQKTLLNHYYLSTQLKGTVYNPSYYFDVNNVNREEALDLLMITQGWRKYVWNEYEMKLNKHSGDKPILRDSIKAQLVYKKKTKKEDPGQYVVMAYTPEHEAEKEWLVIDSTLQFTLSPYLLKLAEKNYLYMKPMISERSRNKLTIRADDPFRQIAPVINDLNITYPIGKQTIEKEPEVRPFQISQGTVALDEITLKGKKDGPKRDKYLGKLDSILSLEVIDYIAEPCGTINCPFHPYEKGNKLPEEGKTYQKYVTTVYVNGKSEEVREYITYFKPKITDEYLLERFNLTRIKGYYGKREFYHPNYDTETKTDPFPDVRNTLFWKSDIITNHQGEALVEFDTSDINSTFNVVIEGVSGQGELGEAHYEFVVNKEAE